VKASLRIALVAAAATLAATARAEDRADDSGAPTWALEAEVVAGIGWVSPGLPADRARPSGLDEQSPWTDCDERGEDCTVRVASAGFDQTLGLRLAAHFAIGPRVALGLGARVQPAAGRGVLAGWVLEASGRLVLYRRGPLGLDLDLRVGAGQIQFQPPQEEVDGPFARSGLAWVALALGGSYAIDDGVELFLALTPRQSFPERVFVLDLGLGLRIRG
tara:strand:- start:27 stop:680 length:654 start_codon:yes stop_codon:yes gene_type:complete